jgi:hypothetical protein
MGAVNGRLDRAEGVFSSRRPVHRSLVQEFVMADLAYLVTVSAGIALVALVAKGVTKL